MQSKDARISALQNSSNGDSNSNEHLGVDGGAFETADSLGASLSLGMEMQLDATAEQQTETEVGGDDDGDDGDDGATVADSNLGVVYLVVSQPCLKPALPHTHQNTLCDNEIIL